jgi:hypothetical protein
MRQVLTIVHWRPTSCFRVRPTIVESLTTPAFGVTLLKFRSWAERPHDFLARAARRAALATNANWPSARWERCFIPYIFASISKNDRHGARRLIPRNRFADPC